jgi:hypothetical protein
VQIIIVYFDANGNGVVVRKGSRYDFYSRLLLLKVGGHKKEVNSGGSFRLVVWVCWSGWVLVPSILQGESADYLLEGSAWLEVSCGVSRVQNAVEFTPVINFLWSACNK